MISSGYRNPLYDGTTAATNPAPPHRDQPTDHPSYQAAPTKLTTPNDGRQKADRETGEPLHVIELVAMDETGAEVIKVTTAGEPKGAKRQLVTVRRLVATPWNIDGRGGVAFRADAISPVPTTASPAPTAGSTKAGPAAESA